MSDAWHDAGSKTAGLDARKGCVCPEVVACCLGLLSGCEGEGGGVVVY